MTQQCDISRPSVNPRPFERHRAAIEKRAAQPPVPAPAIAPSGAEPARTLWLRRDCDRVATHVAFHEASHAVVAVVTGARLGHVSVEPEHPHVAGSGGSLVLMSAAGVWADLLFGFRLASPATGDLSDVTRWVARAPARFAGWEPEVLEATIAAAGRIATAHLPSVNALIDALLRTPYITGARAHAIIGRTAILNRAEVGDLVLEEFRRVATEVEAEKGGVS